MNEHVPGVLSFHHLFFNCFDNEGSAAHAKNTERPQILLGMRRFKG
jgi:hypothetical protein